MDSNCFLILLVIVCLYILMKSDNKGNMFDSNNRLYNNYGNYYSNILENSNIATNYNRSSSLKNAIKEIDERIKDLESRIKSFMEKKKQLVQEKNMVDKQIEQEKVVEEQKRQEVIRDLEKTVKDIDNIKRPVPPMRQYRDSGSVLPSLDDVGIDTNVQSVGNADSILKEIEERSRKGDRPGINLAGSLGAQDRDSRWGNSLNRNKDPSWYQGGTETRQLVGSEHDELYARIKARGMRQDTAGNVYRQVRDYDQSNLPGYVANKNTFTNGYTVDDNIYEQYKDVISNCDSCGYGYQMQAYGVDYPGRVNYGCKMGPDPSPSPSPVSVESFRNY